MYNSNKDIHWWSEVSLRITHPELNPDEITTILNTIPEITNRPGERKIPFGECTSAGYWCYSYRINSPNRPDQALLWAEDFIKEKYSEFLLLKDRNINAYLCLAIFSNVLTIGFEFPKTPTIDSLGINLGIEFYGR